MGYNSWMQKVDAALITCSGLTHQDLPDYCYRDAFEDGLHADEVAEQVMEEALES